MAMAVRWHHEDPWERIRVVRELMPRTRLGFITPGMRFMAWWRAPRDVMELALRCVIRNGIRRIWVAESMNDVATDLEIAALSKRAGAEEVLVGLVYSISPVHTDDYYASRARTVAASGDVDVLNLKDPGGLLTPERVRTLVPALRAAAPELPLEVHTHMTATMGAAPTWRRRELGASFVCTAARPLANGTSQPSTEQTVANLRGEGFTVELDDAALAETSRYFTELAARLGRAVGRPLEYDVGVYRHQLPGGMTSTLRRQLDEVGLGFALAGDPRRAPARPGGARLADHGDAALAVRRRAGVPQRDHRRALVADAGRGDPLRARPVRPAGRRRSTPTWRRRCSPRRARRRSRTSSPASRWRLRAPASATRSPTSCCCSG